MDYFIIGIIACIASLLTFFSGFGLGTILTPAFIIFFPAEIAISLTGVIHFLNNIFKVILTGKNINKKIFFEFGLPSVIAASFGAFTLLLIGNSGVLHTYYIGEKIHQITYLKLILATLMIFFTFADAFPAMINLEIKSGHKGVGGLLSGFFGGLSGHQGALRAAFLIKSGLTKESFIATSVAIGCIVDITRLPIYFSNSSALSVINDNILLISCTVLCAFSGALIGNRLLKKTTLPFMQKLVAVLIVVLSLLLASGLI